MWEDGDFVSNWGGIAVKIGWMEKSQQGCEPAGT